MVDALGALGRDVDEGATQCWWLAGGGIKGVRWRAGQVLEVRDRGWVEISMYPLFSPQSLIAEGSANFGIDMALPPAERVAFCATACGR